MFLSVIDTLPLVPGYSTAAGLASGFCCRSAEYAAITETGKSMTTLDRLVVPSLIPTNQFSSSTLAPTGMLRLNHVSIVSSACMTSVTT